MNRGKASFGPVRRNESKGQPRSRKRRPQRTRFRRRVARVVWALGIAAVMAIGLWGYHKVKPLVSDWTTLEQITVLGLDRVKREEVIALLALPSEVSLFSLDTKAMVERLERHPWVLAASVDRVFPDTLAVLITEREPVAILQSPQGAHFLDDEGYLLSAVDTNFFPSLPIVRGLTPSAFQQKGDSVREQARKAIQVASVLTGEQNGIPTVRVTRQLTFVADLLDTRFHIGSLFDEQWQRFQVLYPSIQDRMEASPKEIDLRYPGKVILRERE